VKREYYFRGGVKKGAEAHWGGTLRIADGEKEGRKKGNRAGSGLHHRGEKVDRRGIRSADRGCRATSRKVLPETARGTQSEVVMVSSKWILYQ